MSDGNGNGNGAAYVSRKWKLAYWPALFAALQWAGTVGVATALLWVQRIDPTSWQAVLASATTAWWLATGTIVGLYYGANVTQKKVPGPHEPTSKEGS